MTEPVRAQVRGSGSGIGRARDLDGERVENAAAAGYLPVKAVDGPSQEVPHRARFERAFGEDFSGVRAFLGRGATAAALGARAVTAGDTVVFGSDHPPAEDVAHELVHVVQARRRPGPPARSVSRPADRSEQEAGALAVDAAAGRTVAVRAHPTAAVHRLSALDIEAILAEKGPGREYPVLRTELHNHLTAEAERTSTPFDELRAQLSEGRLRELVDGFKIARTSATERETPEKGPVEKGITDETMKEKFGFFIESTEPGAVATTFTPQPVHTKGPDLKKAAGDAFVSAIATIPKYPPFALAKRFRAEAFGSAVEADQRLRMAVAVNARAKVDGLVAENEVQGALDGAAEWPQDSFALSADGFVWHPWRAEVKVPAKLDQVRLAFTALPDQSDGLTKSDVVGYETSKKTGAAMVPYGVARNRATALAHKHADDLSKHFDNVLVHFSDPDTPSLLTRVPGPGEKPSRTPESSRPSGSAEQGSPPDSSTAVTSEAIEAEVQESFVPLLTRYQQILDAPGRKDLSSGKLPPLVISGGYELRLQASGGDLADGQALTLIGHRLDLAVRSAIAAARHTAAGANIYLPEPNLLITWNRKLVEVEALFGLGNKESVFLVKNYRKALGDKASLAVAFDLTANSPTETPDRFKLEKTTDPMQHSVSKFAPEQLTAEQLRRVCNQSQCYAKFDTWSIAVNDNLAVKSNLLRPAFNACMITEQYQYDPGLISAALPTFRMPTDAELRKHLDAALSGFKEQWVREAKVKELVDLLHRTGAATQIFMSNLLSQRRIPDPVLELARFNHAVDQAVAAVTKDAAVESEVAEGTAGPQTSSPKPDTGAKAKKVVNQDGVIAAIGKGPLSKVTGLIMGNAVELEDRVLLVYIRALLDAGQPPKNAIAQLGNVCTRRTDGGKGMFDAVVAALFDNQFGNPPEAYLIKVMVPKLNGDGVLPHLLDALVRKLGKEHTADALKPVLDVKIKDGGEIGAFLGLG